jgi:hypothetical protein
VTGIGYFRGRTRLETITTVVPVAEIARGTGLVGTVRAIGTAFFVSKLGLLVTARHVVDEMVSDEAPEGRFNGPPGHALVIMVPLQPSDAPTAVKTVPVQQVSLDMGVSDVAVLRVDMNEFPQAVLPYLQPWPLAYIRPTIGEGCQVIGYDKLAVDEVDTSGETPTAAWSQQLTPQHGLVRELHASGRDNTLAPQPCFATTMETSGGMSGGPVFTEGGLCGVLSSGGTDPYSIASFIATCFYLRIDCDVGTGLQEFRVGDLISAGYIRASGSNFHMRRSGERYAISWPTSEDGDPELG